MDTAQPSVFEADVLEVLSGDDLILMVNLGVEDLYKRQRVRLKDVETPNAIGQGDGTEAGKVRKQVTQLCRNRKVQIARLNQTAHAWVVTLRILVPDSEPIHLNELLIKQGYAFDRRKRND